MNQQPIYLSQPERPADQPQEDAMENDLTNPDQSARGGEGGN